MDAAEGGWGGDRVPELPGSGAGRPQDTASPQNEEVFWAWRSLYVPIYGLIIASIKLVCDQAELWVPSFTFLTFSPKRELVTRNDKSWTEIDHVGP